MKNKWLMDVTSKNKGGISRVFSAETTKEVIRQIQAVGQPFDSLTVQKVPDAPPSNICETCKYWGQNEEPFREAKVCMNVSLRPDAEYVSFIDRASGFDYDNIGRCGFIRTGAKFGCVKWEAKA